MAQRVKVNTNYLQGLAEDYKRSLNKTSTVDIVTFAEASWGLNFRLFPIQKFILKTFYGMELSKTEKIELYDMLNTKHIGSFSEEDFMKYLIDERRTNLTHYEPGKKRRELVLCCGRRSSKSVLASIVANYETYRLVKMDNPQDYYGFPAGQEIAVTTVATTDEQAQTLFDMIKARGMSCNYLKDRIVHSTQTYFNLSTDVDVQKKMSPSIRLLCGGSGSASLRGKNNLIVTFDEAAFFSQGGRNSGTDVYNALTPSIASFTRSGENTDGEGKILLLSSPFSKSGLFYDKYIESFGDEDNMLMYQMYSAMVNPNIDSSFLRSEFRKNKESFLCEFGAEFSDTITSWIEEGILTKIVDRDKTENEFSGVNGIEYYMGIDYGGKTDGTSVSIVHKEGEKIVLDYAEVFYSGSSDVWEVSNSIYKGCSQDYRGYEIVPLGDFAAKIKELCDRFLIVDGWFDQFNGYGLLERLKELGLNQFRMQPMSNGLNTQIFQLSKSLISSELVSIFNHDVLISELLTLEENKTGGKISVEAPRRLGFHDDISDSFVRAVYSCYNATKVVKHAHSIIGGKTGAGGGSRAGSMARSYSAYHLKKAKLHGGNPRIFGI